MSIAQKNYLATNLRYLLTAHHMSTSELARRCHIAQPVLHRLISGKINNPQISTLRPIIDYFHCSFDDLLMQDLSQSHLAPTAETTIPQVIHHMRGNTAIIDAVLVSLQNILHLLPATIPPVLPLKNKSMRNRLC